MIDEGGFGAEALTDVDGFVGVEGEFAAPAAAEIGAYGHPTLAPCRRTQKGTWLCGVDMGLARLRQVSRERQTPARGRGEAEIPNRQLIWRPLRRRVKGEGAPQARDLTIQNLIGSP